MMIVKLKVSIILYLTTTSAYCQNIKDVAKVTQLAKNNSTIKQVNNGHYVLPNVNLSTSQYPAYDHPRMIGQCGGIFRNVQNLIESPKFISARPICNLRCEYQIVSPYICENEFHVQFLEFSLDPSSTCERDRVIINYSDALCGQVSGIKKYRTIGGVLNITFSSAGWDSVGNGFKLLITRLPCIDTKQNQTVNVVDSIMPVLNDDTDDGDYFNVNTSYAVADPSYENNQYPVYGEPAMYNNSTEIELNNRQDIPVLPLPPPSSTPFPIYPTFIPPSVTLPPPILPQCCRNFYNQQRFLMLSQGFPAHTVLHNDCIYVIHKSSSNACRLRIHFKYFLLDDLAQQQGQLGCMNNFIEIDGQRMCGCKTNFVYETQWGLEPKVIRLRTTPGRYLNPQGFIFDIEQLDCPFKYQSAPIRQKRTLIAKKLLLYPFLLGNHLIGLQQQQPQSFPQHQFVDPDEVFLGKFYQPNPSYVSNVCSLNYLKFLQLKVETHGIFKHFCLPLY